jgi:hypothetical protein
MRKALRAKFTTHGAIRQLLLDTGDRQLIENAPMDYYWGCGRTGSGKNRLGQLAAAPGHATWKEDLDLDIVLSELVLAETRSTESTASQRADRKKGGPRRIKRDEE